MNCNAIDKLDLFFSLFLSNVFVKYRTVMVCLWILYIVCHIKIKCLFVNKEQLLFEGKEFVSLYINI